MSVRCVSVLCLLFVISVQSQDKDIFTNFLMDKYGTNGSISLEQLQTLVSSLGVDNLKEPLVSSVSPCNHSTYKQNNTCLKDKCMTTSDIFLLHSQQNNNTAVTEDEVGDMASNILYQLQNTNCHTARLGHHKTKKKPTASEVWGYGLLFVTIINACSVVGILILPCMNKSFYKIILMYMVALAVGSLAGSGLLFLIPDALGLSEIDEVMDQYVWISTTVLGGIYLFFIVERLLKSITEWKKEKRMNKMMLEEEDVTKHQPFSSSIKEHTPLEYNPEFMVPPHLQMHICSSTSTNSTSELYLPDVRPITDSTNMCNGHLTNGADKKIEKCKNRREDIAPVAWMIIFGDALHNFIDGLSIGAAFSDSILAGMSISLAVICEEFPHELGDFAILLNSGMSRKQAVCFNFLSACTCYLGLIVGIVLGEATSASKWIFALAGGMFLYISLADMMPEVNHAAEDPEIKKIGKMKIFLIQNLGILSGYGIMVVLAYFGAQIEF